MKHSPCVVCKQLFLEGTLTWYSNKCATCSEFGEGPDGFGVDPEWEATEANNRHVVKRGPWFAVLLTALVLFALTACSETCGRQEGPHMTIGAGPTECWIYTGEPKCAPALEDEGPCANQRTVFHTGDRLVLWCDLDVLAPKAVMVPTECEQ